MLGFGLLWKIPRRNKVKKDVFVLGSQCHRFQSHLDAFGRQSRIRISLSASTWLSRATQQEGHAGKVQLFRACLRGPLSSN